MQNLLCKYQRKLLLYFIQIGLQEGMEKHNDHLNRHNIQMGRKLHKFRYNQIGNKLNKSLRIFLKSHTCSLKNMSFSKNLFLNLQIIKVYLGIFLHKIEDL